MIFIEHLLSVRLQDSDISKSQAPGAHSLVGEELQRDMYCDGGGLGLGAEKTPDLEGGQRRPPRAGGSQAET